MSVSVKADPCASRYGNLQPAYSKPVSYTARWHEPGYRFSIGDGTWELRETVITNSSGSHAYHVVYPSPVSGDSSSSQANQSAYSHRDFFLSVAGIENGAADCNDMDAVGRVKSSGQTGRLFVTDDYRSKLRPGAFTSSISQLETMRTLSTQLRFRDHGYEVIVAAGFESVQMVDLTACLKEPGDSFGILDGAPGE
ncbi:MAG: hypothetical protein AAF671_13210, partial [Pseudomonadota bacterium]